MQSGYHAALPNVCSTSFISGFSFIDGYKYGFFSYEEFFVEEIFQVPSQYFVFEWSYFVFYLPSFQADKPIGQCVMLVGRDVFAAGFH